MALPLQEVEGIKVSRRSAFAVDASDTDGCRNDSIVLGKVLDRGNETQQQLTIPVRSFKKHISVFGLTGSGKTNTIMAILEDMWKKHRIPFMIIEPAKSEYRVLSELETLKDDLVVLSAGVERTEAASLRLNPFDFVAGQDEEGRRFDVLTHIDRLKAVFNASFPMYASMPYILEDAILELYRERGWDLGSSTNRFIDIYSEDYSDYIPTLRDLYNKIDYAVERRNYWIEQKMNIRAALKTRISSLMVGAKGPMLNCRHSIPPEALFERPVVIELKAIGDDDEKAFIMGLLLSRLYEYRETLGLDHADAPPRHITIVEEAHRLLKQVPPNAESMETGNFRSKAVASFLDMLSELRAFGESIFVVDQLPSRVDSSVVKSTGTKIVHRLLAEDDRDFVGGCMCLNQGQKEDLGVLETGQAVIHQDGTRQAFLCNINMSLSKKGVGGFSTKGSERFLGEYAKIMKSHALCASCTPRCRNLGKLDSEDGQFAAQMRNLMMSIPSLPLETLQQCFSHLKPTRYQKLDMEWPPEERSCWLFSYWGHIADELWAFYGGEYNDFLSVRKRGEVVFAAWTTGGNLEEALKEYSDALKKYTASPNMQLTGCVRCSEVCRYEFLVSMVVSKTDLLWELKKLSVSSRVDKMAILTRKVEAYIRNILPEPTKSMPYKVLKDAAFCVVAHIVDESIHAEHLRDELVDNVLTILSGGDTQ